jgi:hypothetical protein
MYLVMSVVRLATPLPPINNGGRVASVCLFAGEHQAKYNATVATARVQRHDYESSRRLRVIKIATIFINSATNPAEGRLLSEQQSRSRRENRGNQALFLCLAGNRQGRFQ